MKRNKSGTQSVNKGTQFKWSTWPRDFVSQVQPKFWSFYDYNEIRDPGKGLCLLV